MRERPRDPETGLPLSSILPGISPGSVDGWSVHTRALRERQAGEDVIVLSVGDPDFDTPPAITERAIEALREGHTHYTPAGGIRPLREAIAESEGRRLGRDVGINEVVVCAGAQNALYTAMRCIVDPGDEVILLSPPYTMFDGVVGSCGGTVATVPLQRENGFAIDFTKLEAAVSGNTRAILLNSPHNPSGAIAGPGEVARMADLCKANGLWLISDEVYADLCYDAEFVSPSTLPGMRERTVVIRSLSKSHAMSGWRIGWALAPEFLAEAMLDLLNHALYGSPGFIQHACVTALTADIGELEEMKNAYRARRDIVCDAFDPIPGVEVVRPASGLFCILDVSAFGTPTMKIAEELYAAEGVSILPGEAFGTEHDSWMRLALCQPEPAIRDAAARAARFFSGLTMAEPAQQKAAGA